MRCKLSFCWNKLCLCKHISRTFPIWKPQKGHQNTHQNMFEWTITPKILRHVIPYGTKHKVHMLHMVWHHPGTSSVRMHKGNFCLIFSPGRRLMHTHKCLSFFLQKFCIFWICNQILCGRCASSDFCQVSFCVKTLVPGLEGLRTDFPWLNYMVRKTLLVFPNVYMYHAHRTSSRSKNQSKNFWVPYP